MGKREVVSAYAEHASRVPGEPLCISHSRTRSSSPPVTTRPSGSAATAPTLPSWRPSSAGPAPGSAGSHTSTRPSSPAGDHPPVRQHRHRPHPALVAAELGRAGAWLRRVPHQHPAVVRRR